MENIEYVRPQDIEKRSFAIISKELEEKGIVLPKEQELVTKRAIHTSADFDMGDCETLHKILLQIVSFNCAINFSFSSCVFTAIR